MLDFFTFTIISTMIELTNTKYILRRMKNENLVKS